MLIWETTMLLAVVNGRYSLKFRLQKHEEEFYFNHKMNEYLSYSGYNLKRVPAFIAADFRSYGIYVAYGFDHEPTNAELINNYEEMYVEMEDSLRVKRKLLLEDMDRKLSALERGIEEAVLGLPYEVQFAILNDSAKQSLRSRVFPQNLNEEDTAKYWDIIKTIKYVEEANTNGDQL